MLSSFTEHAVPFVNGVTGERCSTRIFHDIGVHDFNHGRASAEEATAVNGGYFAGVDDCGVEGVVVFRFNKGAILSLMWNGFIGHERVIDPGDPPKIMPIIM